MAVTNVRLQKFNMFTSLGNQYRPNLNMNKLLIFGRNAFKNIFFIFRVYRTTTGHKQISLSSRILLKRNLDFFQKNFCSLFRNHSGNYTCAPSNARPTSIMVHVVDGTSYTEISFKQPHLRARQLFKINLPAWC